MKTIKLLIILFIGLSLFSCSTKEEGEVNPDFLYNETCVIKKIDTERRTWLIQRVSNPKEFAELYVENDPQKDTSQDCGCYPVYRYLIPISHFYNKKVGSTIKFDYIIKARFFVIDNYEEPIVKDEYLY